MKNPENSSGLRIFCVIWWRGDAYSFAGTELLGVFSSKNLAQEFLTKYLARQQAYADIENTINAMWIEHREEKAKNPSTFDSDRFVAEKLDPLYRERRQNFLKFKQTSADPDDFYIEDRVLDLMQIQ